MSKKREVRDDEKALWHEVVRDVRRVRRKRVVAASAELRASEKLKKITVMPDPAPRPPPVAKAKVAVKGSGLDGSTSEKLRRGKIVPDAVLDLHGLTQAQAHARLNSFMRSSAELGRRCVLVVTGKGAPQSTRHEADDGFVMPQRSKSGILRMMVPRWLGEGDGRALVAGTQAAHQRHGGDGALYVYLRRRRAE